MYIAQRGFIPGVLKSMENIARYIIRASFSVERLSYIRDDSKVIYKSKNGKDTKEFAVLDFIVCIASHIPNKNEQMVRYMGFYSNVCRGRRKKQGMGESDFVIEDDNNKGANKSILLIFYPKSPVLFLIHPFW